MNYFFVFVVTYFIGSISFGAIIAKLRGVNIFAQGSGSPGATNINRMVGKMAGSIVFLCDFMKGFLPVFVISYHSSIFPGTTFSALALLGALLGHVFSVFHKFRGGKGVATAIGGFLVIVPKTLFIGLPLWLIIFHATKIVSLASLMFIVSVLLSSYLFGYPKEYQILVLLINFIIFFRHRENISRLLSGTEYRFCKKRS